MLKAKPDLNLAGDWCRMDSKSKASLDNLSSCFEKESEKQEWAGELSGRAQGHGFYLQFPKTNNKQTFKSSFSSRPVKGQSQSQSDLTSLPPAACFSHLLCLLRRMPLPPHCFLGQTDTGVVSPAHGPNQQVKPTLRTSQGSFAHSFIKKAMKGPREFMLSKANG